MNKGLFITFEGMDGSGKSTQLERCAEALRADGHTVTVTRNPGGTDFGLKLREILLHSEDQVFPTSELLLFIADRAQHMDAVVFPALAAGGIVLCDRHMDSTVAYQGYGRGLALDTVHELNRIAVQGRRPDLTLLFDGDVAALASRVNKRGKADKVEGEALDFHQRVRQGFLALAEAEPGRVIRLDAMADIESLHQQVMQRVQGLLAAR